MELNDEDMSFENLLESLQAGCFDLVPVSDDLKKAELKKCLVGVKADSLMVASKTQSVCRICTQFGCYVKLTVEIDPAEPDQEPSLLPNAFSILMDSQKLLQQGDNGLPFRQTVKDGRDCMYSDLIIFSLSKVSLSGKLKGICVKDHLCSDPIEKLCSCNCGFDPMCASLDVTEDFEHFPSSGDCKEKVKV